MDAIEATRLRAAELHDKLVSAGHDPSNPYVFILAEAVRRDIQVTALSPGAPQLMGGKALYDPDAGLVLHEESSCAFMNAFLVAHEIGHDEYGGLTKMEPVEDVDPTRRPGGSSRSEGQVVDYHRRDRREVQMDMFAREILLPRHLIRELHLERSLSASEIASRLDAPLEVVYVQLFDAILLPQIQPEKKAESSPKPLNLEQKGAAEHLGAGYLLNAGPGTGKTQTLVGRVATLKDRGVDPEAILVLTFSNKAAGEMLDRITKLWPEAAGAIWTGTFHSFGLDLVRRFHDHLGLKEDLRLIDKADAVALIDEFFPGIELEHYKDIWDPTQQIVTLLNAISRAKDEVCDAATIRQLSERMLVGEPDATQIERAEKALECALVFEEYEKAKRARGLLDFGDLISLPVELLEKHDDVRAHVQSTYLHVLVDEYQDVNRASVRLLKAIKPKGEGLWVVGDVKQAIYRFRGASNRNVVNFENDFPDSSKGRLKTNYRSSSEICKTFDRFAKSVMGPAADGFEVEAFIGASEHRPTYTPNSDKTAEIDGIAERINASIADGRRSRDHAILCKGNDRLADIASGLEQRGLPVLFLGPLFTRTEIRDLLALISLIDDPRGMGLVRAAQIPEFQMTLGDVDNITNRLRPSAGENGPPDWRQLNPNEVELSDVGLEGFRRLQTEFSSFSPEVSPWDLVCELIFEQTRFAARLADRLSSGDANAAIAVWQFQNFLRASAPQGDGTPTHRTLNHIRRLIVLEDERDLRELPPAAQNIDAIRLMTIHGSKGLEFPIVHLPALSKRSIPLSSGHAKIPPLPDGLIEDGLTISEAIKRGHDQEQASIFFVGLSRAEEELHLYGPAPSDKGTAKHSGFVDRISSLLDKQQQRSTVRCVDDEEVDKVDVTYSDIPVLTLSQVGQFDRCPRRFFYSHVLKLGGRRTETPFMKMHNAVHAVIERVCAAIGATIPVSEAQQMLEEVWDELGPSEHGHTEEYKSLAKRLVKSLIELKVGEYTRPVPDLSMTIGPIVIDATGDEWYETPVGQKTMRRVRSGKSFSRMSANLEAGAMKLAAQAHSSGTHAEYIFLTDHVDQEIQMKKQVLNNRHASLEQLANDVVSGKFPTKVDLKFNCSKCPALFVCGDLPGGALIKKKI